MIKNIIKKGIDNMEKDGGYTLKKLIYMGIDYNEIKKEIIKTNKAYLIFDFALFVGGDKELEDALISLESFVYEYALAIENADISKLMHAIVKIGDAKSMYFALLNILDKDEKMLIDGLIKTQNSKYIYYTLLNTNTLYKDDLIDSIIEIENPLYIYLTLKDLDNISDIKEMKLINKLIKLQAYDYICKLILLDIDYAWYLLNFIIQSNNLYYLIYLAKKTNNPLFLKELVDIINKLDPTIDIYRLREEEKHDYEVLFKKKIDKRG